MKRSFLAKNKPESVRPTNLGGAIKYTAEDSLVNTVTKKRGPKASFYFGGLKF